MQPKPRMSPGHLSPRCQDTKRGRPPMGRWQSDAARSDGTSPFGLTGATPLRPTKAMPARPARTHARTHKYNQPSVKLQLAASQTTISRSPIYNQPAAKPVCTGVFIEIRRRTGAGVPGQDAPTLVHERAEASRQNTQAALPGFRTGGRTEKHLLGPRRIGSHGLRRIVGNICTSELLKLASWSGERLEFCHFRDRYDNEVDIVMEDANGHLVGIEVKSAATVTGADFSGLRKLAEACGKRFKIGLVLYDHDVVVPFGERLFAAPLSTLWG